MIIMRNVLIIIVISMILSLPACSGDDHEIVSVPISPSKDELEARVIANTHIVRDALEEFMAHNDELCPFDIYNDTNELGLTVIDLLPDGQLLENPFTGERTEPVDTLATEPGQTGFSVRSYLCPSLYYINGVGELYTIVELSNLEDLNWKVIQNCLTVRDAAERFADLNGGIYPSNVGVDTTPEGYTVIQLLPDGHMLENPLTRACTEPIDGHAATAGQVGYMPIVQSHINTGCEVTGVGAVSGYTILRWSYYPEYSCLTILGETIYCTD